jgi:hypothetical protein
MNAIDSYLSGESFSDDLHYRPPIISHPRARGELLTQWVAGRRVLHVGFADHAPLIASRIAQGTWLHGRLTRSAVVCLGIDVNVQAVAIARSLGFDNVRELDIFSDEALEALAAGHFDLVLVPDVIEHLADPAAFLRRLVRCLPDAEFVVTVPNALSLRNALQALRGQERINTDHRAWFSPFTLLKVLADAGLQAQAVHGCPVHASGSLRSRGLRVLTRWRPIWSDVLLVRARAAEP